MQTIAQMGSSGVGKLTLMNRLLGSVLTKTAPVRLPDGRERHTTTQRQLPRHPTDALLIDNPGNRELGLWGADSGLDDALADILHAAEKCRFRDCRHETEPGCAVVEAVHSGELARERLDGFRKLRRELRYQTQKKLFMGSSLRKQCVRVTDFADFDQFM